jgi:glyoxylase-like metal-dependent hydrolase (beta-lactamase superfamily II)
MQAWSNADMSWVVGQADRIPISLDLIFLPGSHPVRGFDLFSPDVILEDGDALAQYGFDAAVLHLPGHSKGSIGILMPGGEPSQVQALRAYPVLR